MYLHEWSKGIFIHAWNNNRRSDIFFFKNAMKIFYIRCDDFDDYLWFYSFDNVERTILPRRLSRKNAFFDTEYIFYF